MGASALVGDGTMIDESAVNALLVASRAAHDAKKRTVGVIDSKGNVIAQANYATAEQHIVEALRLRLEAHALDPEHAAPAWGDDRRPDADLIKFYVAYSKPFIPAEQMQLVLERFPAYAEIAYIP